MKKLLFILVLLLSSCSNDEEITQECCNKITQVNRFQLATGHTVFHITMWDSCKNIQTFREVTTTSTSFNPQVGDCREN
jgi:hypothetical protein